MKALRWHDRRDVRLEDVEDRPPGSNEVQIDVETCGICGTDVEEYVSGPLVIPKEPHPLTGFCAPMIIGHEVAGRIHRIGSDVRHLHPGQLVGVDGSFFCGTCQACAHRQFNICEKWAFIGMSYPGGLAERMTVPSYMALPVSREVPSEWVSLAEPVSVAVRAARRGRLARGENVAVLGGGTLGLAVLQVARGLGARYITVVEGIPFRRQIASVLGADRVISPDSTLTGQLREACQGRPDIIFDCTGSNESPAAAIEAVRLGGRVVLVGLPAKPTEFVFMQIALREVELIGTLGHIFDEDYSTALDLITSEQVNVEKLITHRLSLRDAVPKGLAALAENAVEDVLKIVITPGNV